jgi:Ca-activated chloride channel family protein
MRTLHRPRWLIPALILLGFLALGLDVHATVVEPDPATAPYFHVNEAGTGVDRFPMKETRVTATLNGVIASVKVRQRYRNEGTVPINAKYVFPGSTRAAVNGMVMRIGSRRITAQIREKEEALKIFEAAKSAGQTASLLAQKRPNVFSMDVANIGVGEDVEVELEYTEFLTPTDGVYEFVYPGVVGPRYGGDATHSREEVTWVGNPYLEEGKPDTTRFDIAVDMTSPLAIQEVQSKTHRLFSTWKGQKIVQITLDEPRETAGNRDFILQYRLQGEQIVSGLTRFRVGGESYFMLQAEPPARVTAAELPLRDYVFIVDVSGSMSGFPLDTAHSLIAKLLSHLTVQDRFNILFFAGGSSVLSPHSLPVTPQNISLAEEMLGRLSGGGGTELLPALEQALAMPVKEGVSRSLVLVTDGYISAEDAAFRLVDDHLSDSNLYVFGIGSSVNRFLVEGLAKVGRAEAFVVTDEADAQREAERFRRYVSAPVLTDISVTGRNLEIFDMEPRTQPDLLADRPVLVIGKYRKAKWNAAIELSGVSGTGKQQWVFELDGSPKDRNLPLLWARKRLERLYVFPNAAVDSREEIRAIGLKYSLLTSATSFVGVDEQLPTGDGPATDVKQPLPLPAGVSNAAVASLTPAPEPSFLGLVAWCALLLGLHVVCSIRRSRSGG